MHLHDLLHAASFNAAVEMQVPFKLAFLNLNVNICLQTFALRRFLFPFFKAAVFKLKLENICPQMAVVLIFFFFLIHYFEEQSEWGLGVALLNPYVKCVFGLKE